MKYLLLVVFAGLLGGCLSSGGKENQSVTLLPDGVIEIHLDRLETGRPFDFYELFESGEPVLDASGKQVCTGMWNKGIRYEGDDVYLLSDLFTGSLTLHKISNGEQICTIGKVGTHLEKGEYSDTRTYMSDRKSNRIYILSNLQGAILKYDFTGKYRGYIPVIKRNPGLVEKMEKLSIGRICGSFRFIPGTSHLLIHYAWWDGNRSPFNFGIIDTCGNVISAKKTFREFNGYTSYGAESSTYVYKNKLHVCDLADTVYVVENNAFIPKYIFTSAHSMEDALAGEKQRRVDLSRGSNLEKTPLIGRVIMENDKYLFFLMRPVNGKYWDVYYCYLDKQEQKAYRLPEAQMPYATYPGRDRLGFRSVPGRKTVYRSYDGNLYKLVLKEDPQKED